MFLNKSKFINHLFQLFSEAQKELVLIVPYVRMSNDVFVELKKCSDRNVQILLVCREDCLKNDELNKLKTLKNLTLLAHPNLHSKIYLNEKHIIIGSMNLYEYSEKFNREAGFKIENSFKYQEDYLEDCKEEIKEIISSSSVMIASRSVQENGVDFKCLYSTEEHLMKKAKTLSSFLVTKHFRVIETDFGYHPTCSNFYDNIDVIVSHRVIIKPNYNYETQKKLFEAYKNIDENLCKPFRIYTDAHDQKFTLYAPKGSSIDDDIYTDKVYAKKVETVVIDFCKRINETYKSIIG